ncbi:flagellar export protein FliJ [Methyloglobulus morosus KoM1]|uniref:Flagellar FliJ protein n=1 Tax=Methyloglobulus morosus KoM1 TaxID=1116472 RepID=V5BJ42_9GAMM|nr:flagellar export protein FliJ [Methyloglobulus morosus]ESS73330.1 flagellar export protein FliJ [Methyloglobulus morosus KoM1]
MIKKSQRIKTIVEIKAAQEKNQLEVLGASQRKLTAMQAQVDGLKKYRMDYQDKFNQLGNVGANVGQLLEFRSFMDKLDTAIAGQELSLDQSRADLAAKRKIWENMHNRTESLKKVYDSALATEIKQESKFEQLAQDERASRLGRNNPGNTSNA